MSSFYITTPIYYVNDVPHLGHAYTSILVDLLSRYHRARGRDTFFLTGTDEHGQKIEQAAQERGIQPQGLADEVVSRFQETWANLNVRSDDFIRTTEPRHAKVVQDLWKRMIAVGDIYLGDYDGLYCVGCEEYYTEAQLSDDGTCPIHGTPPEHLKQPSYFFRMSRYQDRLLEHFDKHPDFVKPDIRRNEILSFIKGGLRDLSISRTTFKWGVEVPDDPDHVMYVWVDALTNYISGLGGFSGNPELYAKFWPASIHLIGKDILRFHAVYWPTMLMSAGLPLPRQIFAHGWWTINGQKMSKSLHNVIEPNMIAKDVGRDALRYFVSRETPLGADGDFSHEGLIHRINAELANDLGNLLNRSMAMAKMYCDAKVPAQCSETAREPMDQEFIDLAQRCRDSAAAFYEEPAPSKALESIWELVRGSNKYIDRTAPYTLIKDPAMRSRVDAVVANFLEALHWISLMVAPVMPDKAMEMRRQLGFGAADQSGALEHWPEVWGELAAGLELEPGDRLFPKIDDKAKAALLEKWGQAGPKKDNKGEKKMEQPEAPQKKPQPAKSTPKKTEEKTGPVKISFDEFSRLDLRVAQIKEAERVEDADRLLKLVVDLGEEQRQVVAGIAESYEPEQLIGRKVIFVANLKPAKIRGVKSEGMILAAGDKKVLALSALDRDVEPGTKIR